MKALSKQTQSVKPADVEKKWHLIDADGLVVGRLASIVANLLRGKHKPQFTPNADVGDFVVVVNSDQLTLTGTKMAKKVYHRHSGYFGGLKSQTASELLEKDSTQMVYLAVKGMLPRGPLGRRQLKKLKIYPGADHPHAAQSPKPLDLGV